jgi:tetratricopeptide (TPR) repeat protein
MGQADAAVAQYMEAQELSNNNALSLYKAAATRLRGGELDDARSLVNRAQEFEKATRIKLKEIAKRLYSALGQAYETQGRMDDAVAVYEEAITAMPRETLFYLKSAQVLVYLQRYTEAEEKLEDVRARGLTDRDQYDYAMRRIASELGRRSQ